MNEIKEQIRQFLYELIPNGKSLNLLDDTPLRTSGIVDSMNMLQIVSFIEERFGIQVEAHEADVDNFDRIEAMAAFVQRKQSCRRLSIGRQWRPILSPSLGVSNGFEYSPFYEGH